MKHVLVAVVLSIFTVVPALATPGAVNKQGCHGRKGPQGYHCHSARDLSTMRNGRRYVAFGDDR
jgi:hypothetical protein